MEFLLGVGALGGRFRGVWASRVLVLAGDKHLETRNQRSPKIQCLGFRVQGRNYAYLGYTGIMENKMETTI